MVLSDRIETAQWEGKDRRKFSQETLQDGPSQRCYIGLLLIYVDVLLHT